MYYNIGSLAIGFTAWVLGFIGIRAEKRKSLYQLSSFTCYCTALLLQFHELKRRCALNDWSAVDDTIGAVTFAASVLIVITVLLNIFSERSKMEEFL